MDKAKNPAAVRGFDGYITPAGCMVAHLRNSTEHNSDIFSITPRSYLKSEDIHRIRSKIKVYGAAEKLNPSDKDSWTEQVITNWTSNGTVSSSSADKKVGDYSRYIYAGTVWALWGKKAISAALCAWPHGYKTLNFWFKCWSTISYVNTFDVRLYSGTDYFTQRIDPVPPDSEWVHYSLPLNFEDWGKEGNPDWTAIDGVMFVIGVATEGNAFMRIDGLYLGGARFSGSAEEASPSYNVRCKEPIIDSALKSDAECALRAESLKDFFKDPVITLSSVLVDGDHRYKPGDRQRVVVSNDNLDEYFRIIKIQHIVSGPTWDTILTLSDEPMRISYIFKVLKEAEKLLKRK